MKREMMHLVWSLAACCMEICVAAVFCYHGLLLRALVCVAQQRDTIEIQYKLWN